MLRTLLLEQGVKFFCDRCKTRYSIGDDRVRGKILKIRCKNCANVITVREGMAADAPGEPSRRGRPTTAAPDAYAGASVSGAAPRAQAAPQVTGRASNGTTQPPPAALEEEWYVSIDGDQEGPFSLVDAQRWIASKPADAELHCWSEGFDDWMPVDKVSHFRNARKQPKPPSAPPPLPRSGPVAAKPVAPARPAEPEPKPLFAATMAALEKDAGEPAAARPTNGAGKAAPKPRNATVQGVGASPLAAFEGESGDSMTAVEAPPFLKEAQTSAEPVASKRATALGAAMPSLPSPLPSPLSSPPSSTNGSAASARGPMPVATPAPGASLDDDDDNLEIGEVSRVVNLADLMRAGPQRTQRAPVSRVSAPIPLARATGAVAKLPAGDVGGLAPAMVDPSAVGAGESLLAPAPAVAAQRRGFVILLAAATVLLLGAAGVVVWIVTSGHGEGGPVVLHHTDGFNTDQPDIVVTRPIIVAGSGAPPAGSRTSGHHSILPSPSRQGTSEIPSTDVEHRALDGDEIQDEASKEAEMTNRCYMRAQRGVDAITIGDVKRIDATLTIDKSGIVSEVRLSSHAGDTLGKCLIARLKGWRFRQNPGGIFRITLAFANG